MLSLGKLLDALIGPPKYEPQQCFCQADAERIRSWAERMGLKIRNHGRYGFVVRARTALIMRSAWAGGVCHIVVRGDGDGYVTEYRLPIPGAIIKFGIFPAFAIAAISSALNGMLVETLVSLTLPFLARPAFEHAAFFGQKSRLDSLVYLRD